MMPGAADGIAVDDAFGERAAVVRARRADREKIAADPREQDGLALRMTKKFAAVGDRRRVDARGQIGTSELRLFRHDWFTYEVRSTNTCTSRRVPLPGTSRITSWCV